MLSVEYRAIIANIVRNSLRKYYPGLKIKSKNGVTQQTENNTDIAVFIARAVHARLYGANVDGVDSPIWSIDQHGTDRIHDPRTKPNVDAGELLKQEE